MDKGNVYDIKGFKYVAMDEKVQNDCHLLLLVNISQVLDISSGKWIAKELLPAPMTKLKHFLTEKNEM